MYALIPPCQVELGEALTARTESLCEQRHIAAELVCLTVRTRFLATFRELGPPDLCHVVKSTGRSGQRDVGLCFCSYVTG